MRSNSLNGNRTNATHERQVGGTLKGVRFLTGACVDLHGITIFHDTAGHGLANTRQDGELIESGLVGVDPREMSPGNIHLVGVTKTRQSDRSYDNPEEDKDSDHMRGDARWGLV